ncbi:MAG: hypothetical protein M3014_02275 [Chloroflexota bacterium]|nr:hypothetical protein [Chloroflexota bacterium]
MAEMPLEKRDQDPPPRPVAGVPAAEMVRLAVTCALVVMALVLTSFVIMLNSSADEFQNWGTDGGLVVVFFLAFAELVMAVLVAMLLFRTGALNRGQGSNIRMAAIAGMLFALIGIVTNPALFVWLSSSGHGNDSLRTPLLLASAALSLAGMSLLLWVTGKASLEQEG